MKLSEKTIASIAMVVKSAALFLVAKLLLVILLDFFPDYGFWTEKIFGAITVLLWVILCLGPFYRKVGPGS